MEDLISTAREFCSWCNAPAGDENEEAGKALSLLVRLYSQAIEIDVPEDFDSDISAERIEDDEWKAVYARAAALPFGYYNAIFNPLVEPPEAPVVLDLADDIADIYRDLSEGLALFDSGYKAEAQWALSFSFHGHWGRHASSAIAALHCWRSDTHKFWNVD